MWLKAVGMGGCPSSCDCLQLCGLPCTLSLLEGGAQGKRKQTVLAGSCFSPGPERAYKDVFGFMCMEIAKKRLQKSL